MSKTIQEEAGLGEHWVPLDEIKPGKAVIGPPVSDTPPLLQGSIPPSYQLSPDFHATGYETKNVPALSLMPLGPQGNPSTNAAAQSTAATTPVVVPPTPGTVSLTFEIPNIFTPPLQTVNLPGLVIFSLASQSANLVWASPDSSSGLPIFRGLVNNDLPIVNVSHGGTGVATLAAHGVVVGNGTSPVNVTSPGTAGQVLTSNGPSVDPTFQTAAAPSAAVKINGAATATDKQIYINGVTDGATVWTIKMNGTPDGG
jgi:hypothetical protein